MEYEKRPDVAGLYNRNILRFTLLENCHVTLVFLGDTDEEVIPVLKARLSDSVKFLKPVKLQYSGIIPASPERPVRMLWVIFKLSETYTRAVWEMSKIVKFVIPDWHGEHRTDSPHLTIARMNVIIKSDRIHMPQFNPDISDL